MMNELIDLILPHKSVFYYDDLALGVMLALMVVDIDLSFDYRNKKHWCAYNKLKSLKDSPGNYHLYADTYPFPTGMLYLCAAENFHRL
ncbi:hypothetical protein [Enterobacter bugandensis]|uniref:hypothetical protein n=1 Tax=Enterobacter bugandensis TaxID=881260 RepID=UPI000669065C|nr:hypothetical protein [Enterobacter bugandensis]MCU6168376.1 hypothetical protein [Enterobacter bugandensis]MDH0086548.1 hypothetical protein [Enterobacter bugandensis]MDH0111619.1 hypothetical protein [Enterobacter bugandensis]MDH0127929.1 hypothetical protein [Enterobacter bugandensis]